MKKWSTCSKDLGNDQDKKLCRLILDEEVVFKRAKVLVR